MSTARDLDFAHAGRFAWFEIDERDTLSLPDLAEVELQERAGVPRGYGDPRHALRLVDVPECDVLGRRRDRLGGYRV